MFWLKKRTEKINATGTKGKPKYNMSISAKSCEKNQKHNRVKIDTNMEITKSLLSLSLIVCPSNAPNIFDSNCRATNYPIHPLEVFYVNKAPNNLFGNHLS